uniref:Cytochrome b6-f complex subunit 7 n=1 Tax=Noccaea caerulescens TaxID=107243 RepID=A0A1J3CIB2_NOCCA
MATAAAPAVISWTRAGIVCKSGQTTQRKPDMKFSYIRGLNSYGGLKAQNNKVVSMGLPLCTEQCFASVVMSLKGRTSGGGALSTTCNAVGEIFKIAAIMNALTLVGVAVGFVLLRIEASVEEAE